MRPASLLSLLVVRFTGTGCAIGYRGGGTFLDKGPLTAHERFTIDLSEIDLNKASRQEFRLVELPNTTFTLGFQVTTKTKANTPLSESRPLNPTIRLTVVEGASLNVITIDAPLKDWVWSGTAINPQQSFVYRRGSDLQPRENATL